MIRTLLAAFLLALPAAAQAEDSQLVTYDLRRVMPRWDEGNSWEQTLLVPPLCHPDNEGESIPMERYAGLQSFELLDLLNQILGEELRREGREMLVEGEALTVLAPASLQQQVRAILDGLEQALASTVSVRVDLFQLSDGAVEPSGVLLGEDEAQKLAASLVASGSRQQTFTAQLSAGRTVVLDAQRSIPFLFDHDVEIAQGASVFVPQMRATRAGTRLVLRGSALPGGTALSVLQVSSELRQLDTLELSIENIVTLTDKPPFTLRGPQLLQSPEVDLTSFACDTFQPDGKAIAFGFESTLAGKKTRQVVLLRRTAGALNSFVLRPIPGTSRSLIALDAELFRPARLETVVTLDDERVSAGLLSPVATASLSFETSGFLVEWLKARFSIWRPFGPWILIVTDPAWDRDAGAQLERLVKSLRPRTSLSEATFELRANGQRAARARVPLLEGSRAGFVLGHGTTAVTGYQAEVAQNAAVHDPTVSAIFDGMVWSCLVQGEAGEVRGVAQLTSPPDALKAAQSGFGVIDRIESQSLRFDERFRLEGRALRFGPASDKGEVGLTFDLTLAPLAR